MDSTAKNVAEINISGSMGKQICAIRCRFNTVLFLKMKKLVADYNNKCKKYNIVLR